MEIPISQRNQLPKQNDIEHDNSISYFFKFALGICNYLSWKMIQPDTHLQYITAIAVGTIAAIPCFGYSRLVYATLIKNKYKTANPLKINFESNSEHLFEAFQKVKNVKAYSLFTKFAKLESKEDSLDYFKRKLTEGLCVGQVTELLKSIEQNPTISPKKLIDKLDLTRICYYQMLETMRYVIETQKQLFKIVLAETESFQNQMSIKKKWKDRLSNLRQKNHQIYSELFPNSIVKKIPFDASSDCDIYYKKFEGLLQRLNKKTIAGRIITSSDETRSSAHMLAFQYGENYSFFYDPEGLYEFEKKADFISTLRIHILYSYGAEAPIYLLAS